MNTNEQYMYIDIHVHVTLSLPPSSCSVPLLLYFPSLSFPSPLLPSLSLFLTLPSPPFPLSHSSLPSLRTLSPPLSLTLPYLFSSPHPTSPPLLSPSFPSLPLPPLPSLSPYPPLPSHPPLPPPLSPYPSPPPSLPLSLSPYPPLPSHPPSHPLSLTLPTPPLSSSLTSSHLTLPFPPSLPSSHPATAPLVFIGALGLFYSLMFLFKTGCTDPGFIPRARPDEAAYNQTLGDESFIELLVWHSFYLSIYLSLYLSIYLSIHLYSSIYMYLSSDLYIYLLKNNKNIYERTCKDIKTRKAHTTLGIVYISKKIQQTIPFYI